MYEELKYDGIRVGAIHADMSASKRSDAVDRCARVNKWETQHINNDRVNWEAVDDKARQSLTAYGTHDALVTNGLVQIG